MPVPVAFRTALSRFWSSFGPPIGRGCWVHAHDARPIFKWGRCRGRLLGNRRQMLVAIDSEYTQSDFAAEHGIVQVGAVGTSPKLVARLCHPGRTGGCSMRVSLRRSWPRFPFRRRAFEHLSRCRSAPRAPCACALEVIVMPPLASSYLALLDKQ